MTKNDKNAKSLYQQIKSLVDDINSICSLSANLRTIYKFLEVEGMDESRKNISNGLLFIEGQVVTALNNIEWEFSESNQQRKDNNLPISKEVHELKESLARSISCIEGLTSIYGTDDITQIKTHLRFTTLANNWLRSIEFYYPEETSNKSASKAKLEDDAGNRAKGREMARNAKEKKEQEVFIETLKDSKEYKQALNVGTLVPGDNGNPPFTWKGSRQSLAKWLSEMPITKRIQADGKETTRWILANGIFEINGNQITNTQLARSYQDYNR